MEKKSYKVQMVRSVFDTNTGIKTSEITEAVLIGKFLNKHWVMACDDDIEGMRTGQWAIVNAEEIKEKE